MSGAGGCTRVYSLGDVRSRGMPSTHARGYTLCAAVHEASAPAACLVSAPAACPVSAPAACPVSVPARLSPAVQSCVARSPPPPCEVFGKELVAQPVIRYKLANSAAALEAAASDPDAEPSPCYPRHATLPTGPSPCCLQSVFCFLESVTYDMCKAEGGEPRARAGQGGARAGLRMSPRACYR